MRAMCGTRRESAPNWHVIPGTATTSMIAYLRPRAHARKLTHILRCQLPFLAFGCKFNECLMKGASGSLHHFGVVKICDRQKNWNSKMCGRPVDLERYAHL